MFLRALTRLRPPLCRMVCICAAALLVTACPGGGGGQGGPPRIECGGGAEFPCPPGMYCSLAQDCGGIDARGVCAVQPRDCPDRDEAVCGCDGNNYGNACYANAAGVTVAYDGHCIGAPKEEEEE